VSPDFYRLKSNINKDTQITYPTNAIQSRAPVQMSTQIYQNCELPIGEPEAPWFPQQEQYHESMVQRPLQRMNNNLLSQSFQDFNPQTLLPAENYPQNYYEGQPQNVQQNFNYPPLVEPESFDNSILNQSMGLIKMSTAINKGRNNPTTFDQNNHSFSNENVRNFPDVNILVF